MDFYWLQEIRKNAVRIQGLTGRVMQVGQVGPGASEQQILLAMQGLVRIAQEAKPTGPLGYALRSESSIASATLQVKREVEKRLAALAEKLESPEMLRKGFDTTRGHFPRVAMDLEQALMKKRSNP